MKISTSKKLLIAFTGVTLLSACKTSPYEGYDDNETGLYSKFYSQGEGVKPQVGDNVVVNIIYKTENDSQIFSSKEMSRDGSGTIEFPLQESTFKGSFEEALLMMSEGDSASFKISADSVYAKTFKSPQMPPYIKPGSMLTFEAKLVKVKPKADVEKERQKMMEEQQAMMQKRQAEEPEAINKYLADNKITAKPTTSGMYIIETQKGKGKKVMAGDSVEVKYKGMFLDGKIFDSSEGSPVPIKFPIGVGAVIPGWDEALTKLSVGSKAKLVIPSNLAYGAQGAQGVIPPYSPLVFEVEVVNTTPAPKK